MRSAMRSSLLSESSRSTSARPSARPSAPSSEATVAKRPLRKAASAAKVASSSPFLRAFPVESTRTRAESLAGTSTTSSPEAASLWAKCRPRPPAFSIAHRRSGKRLAHLSSALSPTRLWGKEVRPSSSPCPSSAATAFLALWGSTPMTTFTTLTSSVDDALLPWRAEENPTLGGVHASAGSPRPPGVGGSQAYAKPARKRRWQEHRERSRPAPLKRSGCRPRSFRRPLHKSERRGLTPMPQPCGLDLLIATA